MAGMRFNLKTLFLMVAAGASWAFAYRTASEHLPLVFGVLFVFTVPAICLSVGIFLVVQLCRGSWRKRP
mgnify:FL=1